MLRIEASVAKKTQKKRKKRRKKGGPPSRDAVMCHMADILFGDKTPINHKISIARMLLEHLGSHDRTSSVKRAESLINALLH